MENTKSKNPATLQFFAIYQKNKKILVLPRFFNKKQMKNEEMNGLSIGVVLSGSIMIPTNLSPWSEITEDSDHVFLMLQSRDSWGNVIDEKTNLMEIDTIRSFVKSLEDSLNNYSWRRDLLSGKFYYKSKEEVPEKTKEMLEPEKNSDGAIPGSNWQI